MHVLVCVLLFLLLLSHLCDFCEQILVMFFFIFFDGARRRGSLLRVARSARRISLSQKVNARYMASSFLLSALSRKPHDVVREKCHQHATCCKITGAGKRHHQQAAHTNILYSRRASAAQAHAPGAVPSARSPCPSGGQPNCVSGFRFVFYAG